jgi:acyl carrier protein
MKLVRSDEFGVRSIYFSRTESRTTNFKLLIEQKRRKMVKPNDPLIEKIKQLIIQRLKLEDMTPEMIETDAPLFGEGLGLDSIDALELVLGLEKEFGVIIPDAEVGKKVFQSVRTMAQYVVENQGTP